MNDLAGLMYDSLQKKILPLADDSYCLSGPLVPGAPVGKTWVPETFSTIGEEKKFNYALQQKTKADFVKGRYRWPGSSSRLFSDQCPHK
jgi:hypothetical protein